MQDYRHTLSILLLFINLFETIMCVWLICNLFEYVVYYSYFPLFDLQFSQYVNNDTNKKLSQKMLDAISCWYDWVVNHHKYGKTATSQLNLGHNLILISVSSVCIVCNISFVSIYFHLISSFKHMMYPTAVNNLSVFIFCDLQH